MPRDKNNGRTNVQLIGAFDVGPRCTSVGAVDGDDGDDDDEPIFWAAAETIVTTNNNPKSFSMYANAYNGRLFNVENIVNDCRLLRIFFSLYFIGLKQQQTNSIRKFEKKKTKRNSTMNFRHKIYAQKYTDLKPKIIKKNKSPKINCSTFYFSISLASL